MARIEGLESRRLFAALQPDVTWADDGYVDRKADHTFLAVTNAGIVTSDPSFNSDDADPNLITRYTTDGTRDAAFHDIRPDFGYSAAVDPLGRIYVLTPVDGKPGRLRLARYAADGQADAAWGDDGVVSIDLNDSTVSGGVVVDRVALRADGSVYPTLSYSNSHYVADVEDFVGGPHTRVYKFDDTGAADKAFGDGGSIDFAAGADEGSQFVWTGVQPSGKVVFVQSGDFDTFITRYNADGTDDKTYGSFTDQNSPKIEGNLTEQGLALDAQGRLIAAEQGFNDDPLSDTSDAYYQVSRFTVDGLPDATFADKGVFNITDTATANGDAGAVLPQKNGKLIVRLGEQIFRLTAGGHADSSYTDRGRFDVSSDVEDVVGQLPDGSLIARATSHVNDVYAYGVAKLTPRTEVAQGNSGTLYLNGTDGGDNFLLRGVKADATAVVELAGEYYGAFGGITGVVVDLGAGSDVYVDTYFAHGTVADTVSGGDGNDSIVTGGGDDSIDSGDGDDTVQSGNGYDTLNLGDGSATVDAGTGGGDIRFYPDKDQTVVLRGTGGRWTVNGFGGHADIVLTGQSANVFFDADRASTFDVNMTDGATVSAGGGNDSITTGDGPDQIIPGRGSDTVVSGAGNDSVYGEDDVFTAGDEPADDVYDLGAGNDTAVDAYGNNTINGGDGDDSIRTGEGNDSLLGNGGRDTIRAGNGDDTLLGGSGRDRLFAYAGRDVLSGGGNDDTLCGGTGDDQLFGGAGDDLLWAADPEARVDTARNTLGGGAGDDRYLTESDGDVIDRVERVYK